MSKLKKKGKIHDTVTGYDFTIDEALTRAIAIRVKCLECQNDQPAEVRYCDLSDCALWKWRMGPKGEVGWISRPESGRGSLSDEELDGIDPNIDQEEVAGKEAVGTRISSSEDAA